MESELKHIHRDIEELKREVSIIRHILSEERELTEEAKKRLAAARATPDSDYVSHNDLKKRVLKSSYRQSA